MSPQVTNCCCCIPLKNGAVIITLIWLIYGIYETVDNSLSIATPAEENAFNYITISTIVLYGLMSIGAAFGLFVLTCANISKMLLIYSYITYGIVVINIVSYMEAIIVSAAFKSEILDACVVANLSDDQGSEDCNDAYNNFITSLIVSAVATTILSVYFSIVIISYTKRRNEKEKIKQLCGKGDIFADKLYEKDNMATDKQLFEKTNNL